MKACPSPKSAFAPSLIACCLLGALFILFSTVQVHAATFTVTTTADSGTGSLRDAISLAGPGDTIDFDPSVTAISLTSGELLVDKALTINGGGTVTIDPSTTSRIFNIDDFIRMILK